MTPRCVQCLRPDDQCVCRWLEPVATRTKVTVLQHPGERKHAFNTARLLGKVLARGTVHIAWPDAEGRMTAPVRPGPGAVLLFPSDDAVDVGAWSGPPPEELYVLDGTWSQVKRLLHDNPWLRDLPAVSLSPEEGSRYRIRKEPAPHCLSTLESVVQALQGLEPETPGLARALEPFEAMVDAHLAARPAPSPRRVDKGRESPWARLRAWDRVVLVYAEVMGLKGAPRELVQWAAVRPAGGEVLDVRITPSLAPDPCVWDRTGLPLEGGVPAAALPAAWQAFARPDDAVFAWGGSTGGLARRAGLDVRVTGLKELYGVQQGGVRGRLDAVLEAHGLGSTPVGVEGRAARRLGHLVSVARFLGGAPQ